MKKFVKEEKQLQLVGSFSHPNKLINAIETGKIKLEVLFLDIEMPGCNGLQLAERIFEIDDSIAVIFVTAYDNYAVKAFELNALDYLLKPVCKERFQKTICRLDTKKEKKYKNKSLLRVVSLGNFNIFSQNKKVNLNWRTAKTEELFLYLLYYQGDFVSKDKIASVLWSGKDPDRALNILYTTVYSLRKMFKNVGYKQVVKSKRGYYSLNMEQISWDVIEYIKLASKVDKNVKLYLKEVKNIIDLYQEDYLSGRDYDWAYGLRTELKEKFKNILNKAADYYLEEEKYEEAISVLKHIINEVYFDDRSYKKLINVYKKLGDEFLARKQYEEYRTKLIKEFGIEPEIRFF